MKYSVLGSGSQGNSLLIYNDEIKILIDCGLSLKKIKEKSEEESFKEVFGKELNNLDYEVTGEATHHGPDIATPSLFIEIIFYWLNI